MRYTRESINKLKQSVDIVDVIIRFVALRKIRNYYVGNCPFHKDNSSFFVLPEKKTFNCISCSAYGDALDFLIENNKMDVKDALEYLSELYKVSLEIENKEKTEKILSTPVDEVEFSIRTCNFLYRLDIKTIFDLICYSENELLAVRCLGKKTLKEIQDKLSEFGLSLAENRYEKSEKLK